MLKRILTGVIAISIFVPFLIFSHTLAFPIIMGFCAAISVWEMLHCAGLHKNFWLSLPLYPVAAVMPFVMRWFKLEVALIVGLMSILLLMLYVFAVSVLGHKKVGVTDAAAVFMTFIYSVAGFTAIIFLRDYIEGGQYMYLMVFIGAWITDTFAYFGGRLFGKHKLIPEVSPKKTIEGSISGTLFGLLSFVAFAFIYNQWLLPDGGTAIPYWVMILVGFVTAIVSQIGDLSMSVLKRHYGIKDYGKIFPGHGGILDRFDSVLPVAVVMACTLGLLL